MTHQDIVDQILEDIDEDPDHRTHSEELAWEAAKWIRNLRSKVLLLLLFHSDIEKALKRLNTEHETNPFAITEFITSVSLALNNHDKRLPKPTNSQSQ